MSLMHTCSKCGREIEPGDELLKLENQSQLAYPELDDVYLCEACTIDFEVWLKSPLSFASALHVCGADRDDY